jgi:hypothetical protein
MSSPVCFTSASRRLPKDTIVVAAADTQAESWSKGTRIVAVFVTGYHRQAVAGLPKGTPLIVSSQEEKQPCGYTTASATKAI